MNTDRLLATVVLTLILLTSTTLAVKKIGSYNGKALLGTDRYVLSVYAQDKEINLRQGITINDKYNFYPIPEIVLSGEEYKLSPPEGQSLKVMEERESYSLEFSGNIKEKKMKVEEHLDINEGNIIASTRVINEGDRPRNVSITYRAGGKENNVIFFPGKVHNETSNFLVFTDKDHKGLSLGIITNNYFEGPGEFSEISSFDLPKKKEVAPGGSIHFRLELKPISIWSKNGELEYDTKYTPYIENPAIETTGNINVTPSGSLSSKYSSILSEVSSSSGNGNGEFSSISEVDLSESDVNSLEAAVKFDEACEVAEIPSKLVIGSVGDKKYAWVKVLEGKEWVGYDPFKGEETNPSLYDVVYEEPSPKFIGVEGKEMKGEAYLNAVREIKEKENPLLMPLLFLALVSLIVFVFLLWKSDMILGSMMSREEDVEEEKPINGEYEVIKGKEELEDKTVKPILEKIKEENGEVEIQRYSEETKFSATLIEHYVDYLREEGFIRMKSRSKNEFKEDTVEDVKERVGEEGAGSKIALPSFLSNLADKLGLSQIQMMLIVLIIIIGLVGMAMLLFI